MADSRLQQLSITNRNPSEEAEYKNLLSQGGYDYFSGGNNSSVSQFNGATGYGGAPLTDPIKQAQKFLDFQKQANQPIVASLQASQDPLKDKYTQLVNSIKGNQQLDSNRQTLTTANTLGGRGLSSDSGVYQQEMTNALTPIDTQYSGLLANAGAGSIDDLQALALQIAQLQAGDPSSALSNTFQYQGLQQQAQQAQQQNAYQNSYLDLQRQIANQKSTDLKNNYLAVPEGNSVLDLITGRSIFNNPKTYKAGGADNNPGGV